MVRSNQQHCFAGPLTERINHVMMSVVFCNLKFYNLNLNCSAISKTRELNTLEISKYHNLYGPMWSAVRGHSYHEETVFVV